MRIGFDVSQTAGKKAGCGFFADQLVWALAKIDSENDYLLYPTFYSYRDPRFFKTTNPKASNFNRHFSWMSVPAILFGWNRALAHKTEWLGSPDIVHSNNFSCVKDHRAKIVYTLYDLSPFICPEYMTEANRKLCSRGLVQASRNADHCIAISEYTKQTFLEYFPNYPESQITVIPLGVRDTIHLVKDPLTIQNRLRRFDLKGDFWLGVGTLEPRKNYRLFIEAYAALHDTRPFVIAGSKGWMESNIGQFVKNKGLENRIRFIGYVSDEELSALYSACFAFVYPSLFEGFGLPVLEAMHCGAAVITSGSSSLPEVGGDSALYIDPNSVDSLVEKMKSLTENEALRLDCKTKAVHRSKYYSWDSAAQIVMNVYKLLGQR